MQQNPFVENPYAAPQEIVPAEVATPPRKPPRGTLREAILFCVKLAVGWVLCMLALALIGGLLAATTQSPNFGVGYTEIIVTTLPFIFFGVRRLLAVSST